MDDTAEAEFEGLERYKALDCMAKAVKHDLGRLNTYFDDFKLGQDKFAEEVALYAEQWDGAG